MAPVPESETDIAARRAATADRDPAPPRYRPLPYVAPVLLAVGVLVMALMTQEDGHGWGDDFALYINQARGMVEGTAAQVVADNRFAMENSAFRGFTPIAYPWVTSLLLMPIVALFGVDYALLKLVPTAALVAAVLLYWGLARRRIGAVGAVLLGGWLAVNPWYLWATDAVLSDIIFLAATLLSITLLDRVVARGTMFDTSARDVALAGLAIAAAAHVRREGLGLMAALAVVQAAEWWRAAAPRPRWRAAIAPWAWTIGGFGVFHLLFPAPIRIDLDTGAESGLGSIGTNVWWYRNAIAELIGLQRIGDRPTEAFGSETLGSVWLVTVIALAVLAAGFAVWRALRRRAAPDLPLAGALAGIALVVSMAPFHYQRYLMTVAPLLVLLAMTGAWRLGRRLARGLPRAAPWIAVSVVAVLLLPAVVVQVDETAHSLRYHVANDYVSRGPEDAPTQDLWRAVIAHTNEDEVVMFAQPRSMNLYTRRRSVLGNDRNVLMQRADWYAMERNSDYLQVDLSPGEARDLGLVSVWANERYVLWRVPDDR